jgi:Holliday junction resolvase RusA-like endonuclease
MIEFTVPGEAKTERKRQRFISTKSGAVVGSRTDEPDRKDFKARVAFFAVASGIKPMEGPLRLELAIRRPKPESWPKKPCLRNLWPWAWWRKPDLENFCKILSDALNGIAWHDDAQIVDLVLRKRWAQTDEVLVRVSEVTEEEIEATP